MGLPSSSLNLPCCNQNTPSKNAKLGTSWLCFEILPWLSLAFGIKPKLLQEVRKTLHHQRGMPLFSIMSSLHLHCLFCALFSSLTEPSLKTPYSSFSSPIFVPAVEHASFPPSQFPEVWSLICTPLSPCTSSITEAVVLCFPDCLSIPPNGSLYIILSVSPGNDVT